MRAWGNEEQIVEKLKKQHHTRPEVLQSLMSPSKGKGKRKEVITTYIVFGHPSRPGYEHHVSSAQPSETLSGGVRISMGDQIRISRVVIISFFSSFSFEGDIKDCRTPSLV